jgi:hypothetical protein
MQILILFLKMLYHAWVADGFKETFFCNDPENGFPGATYLFFHMNWGWDDSRYNGWFGYGTANSGSPGGNYQYKREMVIGIKP